MALIDITSYPVAHNKNGGGSGGSTYIMGSQKSGTYNSLNVHSINASQGNIDYLKSKAISANEGSFIYLQAKDGQIIKLKGDSLEYNTGYIGSLASDYITTNKLKAEDIEAVNAWIETLNSKEITTEYLTVTKQAHFFELIIDKIRSVGGQLILTPASCVVDYVMAYDSNNTRIPEVTPSNVNDVAYFNVYFRSTEDTGRSISNDFISNDQVICQSFNNVHVGTNYNVSNKYYWRLVEDVLNDTYVNLSTGALSNSPNVSSNNSFNVMLQNTYTTTLQNDSSVNVENGIQWQVAAQTIPGIYTNVSWNDGSVVEGYCVNGTFESASKIYGIQITPILQEDTPLPITSALAFNIKQTVESGSYTIPHNINIGVYFTDNTYMVFNDVHFDSNYDCTLDLNNPESAIEAIVIVSTNDVDWHLCHGIRISNTVCDEMLDGYSSIPSTGDNLVQLGYRGIDDNDRQSAIIISAYKSPDPGVHAPSYAQYRGINDFDLGSHRGSYIDARGAKFVGDITLCTIGGKTIGEALAEQEAELETKNKQLIVSTTTIGVYPYPNDANDRVYRLDPTHLDVSILMNGENGMTTYTTVPEGYYVDFVFTNNAGTDISQYDFRKTEGQSLSHLELPKGINIGDINSLYVKLVKDESDTPGANDIIVDVVIISYIRAALPAVDGGHYELRYKNAHSLTSDNLPAEGSDGYSDAGANGWTKTVEAPNVLNEIYTWMCQCYVNATGAYGTWEGPYRLTGGNGKDGEDGTDIEFIYAQKDERWTNPVAPTTTDDPTIAQDDWPNIDGHTHSKTVNGTTWTDNPLGVDSTHKFEYMAQRYKLPGSASWTPYTTPCIWSNWGEKGQDGDGFEYIFLLSNQFPSTYIANPTPNDWQTPSSYYQTHDEYVVYLQSHIPSGYDAAHWWTDDPTSVTQDWPYIYVCKRTKKPGNNGLMVWSEFSDPALWGRYASQGETGGHYEFRYCNFTPPYDGATPYEPDAGSDGIGTYGFDPQLRATWGYAVTDPDVENGEYTYMSQCYVTPHTSGDTYGTWSEAVRITGGNGKAGEDGADIEFIYAQKSETWSNAAAPTTSDDPTVAQDDWPNIDGHTPSKTITKDGVSTTWWDNPQGVTSSIKYEYMSQRIKPRGSNTWGPYTTPVIWSAYGDKGQDGDGFEYIYKSFPPANLQSEYTALTNEYSADPTSNYQTHDEYYSYLNGWSDDPVSPTLGNPCWCSVRKKRNNSWTAFSQPSQWSMYITAEGGTPGADGQNAQIDYLIPNKERLVSKFITSIVDETNCDLECELDYTLVHVDGDTVTTKAWASPYKIKLTAVNKNLNTMSWTRYMTSNGTSSGTPQGTYTASNLLSVINSSGAAAKRDYMKCYEQYPNDCPVYLVVELLYGSTVLDKRVVNVELESGAVSKVTDKAITNAVAASKTYTDTLENYIQNNYSTTQQTADQISSTVSQQMNGYAQTSWVTSQINQKANEISSTVRDEYVSKDMYLDDKNSFSIVLDLLNTSYDENSYYPVAVPMNPVNGGEAMSISKGLTVTFQVDRSLNEPGFQAPSNNKYRPSWGSVYIDNGVANSFTRGVALCCNWSIIPSQWGQWSNGEQYINEYILRYTRKGAITTPPDPTVINDGDNSHCKIKVIGNIEQHNPSSVAVFYLRGGSKYNLRCNWNILTRQYEKDENGNPTSTVKIYGAEIHRTGFNTSIYKNTSENKQYNVIVGADSSNLNIPVKDHLNYSEISQTARNISLSVFQEQDTDNDGIADALLRTGIDIENGKINLTAQNTNVNGTLNIYQDNQGLQVWDSSRTRCAQVSNLANGLLENYNPSAHISYNFSTSKNVSGKSYSFTFGRNSIGQAYSGVNFSLNAFLAAAGMTDGYGYEFNGYDGNCTAMSYTAKITTSNGTIRTQKSGNVELPSAGARPSWMGLYLFDMEYTPSTSEVLYLDLTLNITASESHAGTAIAVVDCNFYQEITSTVKLAYDGMVLGTDDENEYFWWGRKKIGDRQGYDYQLMARARRHNFKVNTFGVMRTFYTGSDTPGGSGEYAIGKKDDEYWCDIGSYTPVMSLSSDTNLETYKEQGILVLLEKGIIINTSSNTITVNLPDPAKMPGKQIWFKGIGGGGIKFTCTFNNNNHFVFDDNSNKMKECGPTTTTGMLFSAGGYWIHFNSN